MTTYRPPTCKHGCTDECIVCIEEKAHAAGKLEAAQHILDVFEKKPWNFYRDLKAYVEELK